MALFGKKKKKEDDVKKLGFGFPATEKRQESDREGITPITKPVPPPPEPAPQPRQPAVQPQPVRAPEASRPLPPPEPAKAPAPAPTPAPKPAPVPRTPAPAAKPEVKPVLEARPAAPTMPEKIEAPRAPAISKLRPHVFLKISKYKEVMSNIDKIMEHIKGLKSSLKNIKEVDEKESIKIKESDELLVKLENVAKVFDKIFSNPEK
ncbi:hypothetical protein GF352_01535 [archaeon]|nr:hypothetical protein [archaeon]